MVSEAHGLLAENRAKITREMTKEHPTQKQDSLKIAHEVAYEMFWEQVWADLSAQDEADLLPAAEPEDIGTA